MNWDRIKKEVTIFRSVMAMLATVLTVMVSWNTLGLDTVAFTSQVTAVEANVEDAVTYSEDTRIMFFEQQKAIAEDKLFRAKLLLEADATNELLITRVSNLKAEVKRIQLLIDAIKKNHDHDESY